MSRTRDLLYSSGNLAASLSLSVFATYLMFFAVDVLKLPAELTGIAMGVSAIWNAVSNPLFGQLSDRTHSRRGRRLVYIRFGMIPLAIAFALLWAPPVKAAAHSPGLVIAYLLLLIFLFDTLYTMVVLNWTALFPEMYGSQEERTRVSVYRQIFGIVGNIIGIALPPILYGSVGWSAMGLAFAVVTLVFLFLSLFGSKENPAFGAAPGLALLPSLAATFKNRSFLTYVIAALFLQFTFVMLQASLPFYAKYVLGIAGLKVSLLLGIIFVSAVIWVRLWARRANRRGSKNTIMIAVVLYGIALVPFWFARSFLAAFITAGVLGFGLAGLIVLLDVLLSDVIDEDETRTGARREGMYYGINGFMVRVTVTFQSVIMGTILATSGYDAKLPVGLQPAGALTGIKSLVVLIPLASLVFALIAYRLYPLYGRRLLEVKEAVGRLHAGERRLDPEQHG